MRELNRQRREASAAQAEAPISADAGMLNVPFLGNRALNLANRGKIDLERPQFAANTLEESRRRGGILGAARATASRIRSGKNSPDERGQRKATGSVMDSTFAGGAGPKDSKNPVKKAVQQSSRMMMGGVIRGCWGALWMSFGHTIYFIDILFLAQAGSKYLRKYIPAVGEEWFPPQFLKLIPKTTLLPIKLGEILAMAFITFWVFMIDMLLISVFAVVYSIVDGVAKHL